GRCLQPSDLSDVRLPLRVELGSCSLNPATFLNLCPGDRIRLETRGTQAASLKLNGRVVALGDAGEYRGMAAFLVRSGRREIA
ncbi:MAG: FliM/FliN family flagellar motor C-terminal domain-containing protein, partial [Candidatus Eremiobacteraeota bacterium]|nr:FliM/FliN family flagellar motor C-terminal domain-containing protein [Candidatus Eremiobacteraeota bacterium]